MSGQTVMEPQVRPETGGPDPKIRVIGFVCTGNTCRSPMAEAVANDWFREEGILAVSAGLCVPEPGPMTDHALEALENRGIRPNPARDYREHCSRQIDELFLSQVDLVFGITERHAYSILTSYPEFAGKLRPFGAAIPDPFGGSLEVYLETLDRIMHVLNEWKGKIHERF